MNQLPCHNGTMAAVRCSMEETNAAMSSCLSEGKHKLVGVGSVNGPDSIFASGVIDVVEKVLLELDKKVYICKCHMPFTHL